MFEDFLVYLLYTALLRRRALAPQAVEIGTIRQTIISVRFLLGWHIVVALCVPLIDHFYNIVIGGFINLDITSFTNSVFTSLSNKSAPTFVQTVEDLPSKLLNILYHNFDWVYCLELK